MAVLAMQRSLDLPFGFDLDIEKGIPLGSGLGGSAASAVAGVVALYVLLVGAPMVLVTLVTKKPGPLYAVGLLGGAGLVEELAHLRVGVDAAGGNERDALALDAKIVIDDNELFWRPDLGLLRDDTAEEPSEAVARRANLSFIIPGTRLSP